MYKVKVYILMCLSIMLPILLSAAPIDKYYVPPQSSGYTTQTTEPDVYDKFRNKVSILSLEDRNELKRFYQGKMDDAAKHQNYAAAAYYKKLIDILNSF